MKRLICIMFCGCFTLIAQSRQFIPGDLNGDGLVDADDITRSVDLVLGRDPPPTVKEFSAADLDGDGRITVRDVIILAQTIRGSNRAPVANASASSDSGYVALPVQLDGSDSFDLDSDNLTFAWRQLQMPDKGRVYVTTNTIVVDNPTAVTTSFTPAWPGNYRFELQVMDVGGLSSRDTVDVLVLNENAPQFAVKGIIFGDVFGELGGPAFNILPDDSVASVEVLGSAMEGATRVGAGWVGIVPAAWYSRINPLPEIDKGPNSLGLTDESDYGAIIRAAHAKNLRVVQREQLASGVLPLRAGEADSLRFLMDTSPAWWDQWFTEWKAYLLERAEMAERHGVEMLDLFHGGDDTFNPTIYPEYDARWRDIIAGVRQVYSGIVTMNVFNATHLSFADALDVLHITVFGDQYIARNVFADAKNPQLNEVISISEDILDGHQLDTGGAVPVYYIMTINSSDAQVSGDPVPPPDEKIDNREQVLYYEGFLQALEDETWVSGFFSERWAWFDQLDRPGVYDDQQTGSSLRNKPAEEFLRIWFGGH